MRHDPGELAARWRALIAGRPFVPHRWLWNGHLQTIVASRNRREFPPTEERPFQQTIDLADGARLSVTRLVAGPSAPTLVVVHGMAGSSESDYMNAFSVKAFGLGWSSLLFNLYDRNGTREVPRLFDAGCSEQLVEALELLRGSEGLGRVFIVGVSMGGNIVLKALGDWGKEVPEWLIGAAVISPLVDLSTSWQPIERPGNWVYRSHYLRRLKRLTREQTRGWGSRVDFARLGAVSSIRQYDEAVTVPVGGYRNVHHYYETASASRVIGSIRVPTLAIHSQDDPFLPWEPLTRPEVRGNPWISAVLTRSGGHVGFIEQHRVDMDRSWAENRVLDFFALVLR